MASLYSKQGSTKIWIRYKNAAGIWKGKPTKYRFGNLGDERQAKLLARRQSDIEASRSSVPISAKFSEWVIPWLITKYGGGETTTLGVYKRTWRSVQRYLDQQKLSMASEITRDFITRYMVWRTNDAGRNTAISDIKLFAMVLDEAEKAGHCPSNPLRKAGLKKAPAAEKLLWSNQQMEIAGKHIEKHGSLWQRVAFYFGVFQACRLRQCQLPLTAIRFELGVIQYPGKLVKGREGYTQPIDSRFLPILKKLVKEAKDAGQDTLCTVPWDASMRFRDTFDRAGLPGLSHHGLRVTWITRAAERGVPESQAMAFAHHESAEVHRIYKKLMSVVPVHVPAMLDLPSFASAPGEDAPSTKRGNARASSRSRIQKRNPGKLPPPFARGENRKIAPSLPHAEE